MELIAWLLIGYLSGSLPTGYLMGRMLKGIDIRRHGSGNPGATNVFRVVGTVPGIVTLIVDFFKGFLPVLFASRSFADPLPVLLVGLAAIAGHLWTVFLRFHGGKGVATGTGVFAALLPLPTLCAFALFALVLAVTHYVSLGSVLAALSLPLFALLLDKPWPLIAFTAFTALLIAYTHRSNLGRLFSGTERKTYLFRKGTPS